MKQLPKILAVCIGLIFLGFLVYWVPQQIPYKVTLFDASTKSPLRNTTLEIHYDSFDVSSPASPSELIFEGTTDEDGVVSLRGHRASDFNQLGQGNRMYEYWVVIDGQTFNQIEKQESGKGVYLLMTDGAITERGIYSQNNHYFVEAGGYSGGYREEDQPTSFSVVAKRGNQTIFDHEILGEDVQTTGAFPTILGITNDAEEVWGLSHIHGTCPCSLGLWKINRKGEVTKFPELYDLKIEQAFSDYNFDEAIVVGVARKQWPPFPDKPWGEELWYVDLDTGETHLLFETEIGRMEAISLTDDMHVSFQLSEWDYATNQFDEGMERTIQLNP